LLNLPKPPLDKPSPANLTDPDFQDFDYLSLNSGRFSGIISYEGIWGTGGCENDDCEKFMIFVEISAI
jgi:hypothetical protein